MSSTPRLWKHRIRHILNAVAESEGFLKGLTLEQFAADARTLKAVVWNLLIIGEASRHIPPEVEAAFSEIPWATIRGMRNHIVHG